MYNTELPNRAELPSSRQLMRSTFLAALTAVVLLLTAILPAEYGIDPTGIGRMLGLKRMGEIKVSLANEAAQQVPSAIAPAIEKSAGGNAVATKSATVDATEKTDEIAIELKPGESAEIKLDMSQGAKVTYQWTVQGGGVNFDTHGDPINPPKDFYHGYGKGKRSLGDKGTLVAAFDGKHGWFWRNRSNDNASITLITQGSYGAMKRIL